MTFWVYVNINVSIGHRDHIKVFASQEAALSWFELNDPDGVAFEYEVLGALTTIREAHDRFQLEVDQILDNLRRKS